MSLHEVTAEHIARVADAQLKAAGLSDLIRPTAVRDVLQGIPLRGDRPESREAVDATIATVAKAYGGGDATTSEPAPAHENETQKVMRKAREAGRPTGSYTVGNTPMRAPVDLMADRVKIGINGGNPWADGSWNVTRQELLRVADPALAARLKSEAGR